MRRLLGTALALLGASGLLFTTNIEILLAYTLVLIACMLPIAIWLLGNSASMPVLPAMAGIYFLYYAVPILRDNSHYRDYVSTPTEILNAGIAVSMFLFAATAVWSFVMYGKRKRPLRGGTASDLVSGIQLNNVIIFGIGLGVFFYVTMWSGWLASLSSFYGSFRSITVAAASVACFLLGYARGIGTMQGKKWSTAIVLLGALVSLELGGLFLVLALVHVFSVLMGYMIAAGRIPWRTSLVALLVLSVLQSGKSEMRTKYWSGEAGAETSLMDVPGVLVDWVVAGVTSYGSESARGPGLIDRASLLTLLLRVQRVTPEYIPFLGGESYTLLPYMLVPRFIMPDKIASQASMILLNVHYEIQTAEGAQTTAIGWGPVVEAYANFGYPGVIGVGMLLGLLIGILTRWGAGRPIVSLPSLVTIAGLVTVINAESDLSYMITNFLQTLASIFFFYLLLREFILTRNKNSAPQVVKPREFIPG